MKLIKAYVRVVIVDEVLEALEEIKVPGITAIDIRALSKDISSEELKYSAEYGSGYETMVKLEIICPEERVEEIVRVIKEKAHTGRKGDGLIAISPIEDVIHIRTGNRGKTLLTNEE